MLAQRHWVIISGSVGVDVSGVFHPLTGSVVIIAVFARPVCATGNAGTVNAKAGSDVSVTGFSVTAVWVSRGLESNNKSNAKLSGVSFARLVGQGFSLSKSILGRNSSVEKQGSTFATNFAIENGHWEQGTGAPPQTIMTLTVWLIQTVTFPAKFI